MNLIRSFNVIAWKKPDISEFYLATVFGFFLFQLLQSPIFQLASWLISGVQTVFAYTPTVNEVWYCLVVVCFALIILIKTYIIQPLGLNVNKQSASSWETFFTFVAVIGFFLFIVNNSFRSVAMPTDLPIWIIRSIDGWENTFGSPLSSSLQERNFWSVIPYIWVIFPLLMFYFPIIRGESSAPKKEG